MPAKRFDSKKFHAMCATDGSPLDAALNIIKTAVADQVDLYEEWASDDHGADEEECSAAGAYALELIAGAVLSGSLVIRLQSGHKPTETMIHAIDSTLFHAERCLQETFIESRVQNSVDKGEVEAMLQKVLARYGGIGKAKP